MTDTNKPRVYVAARYARRSDAALTAQLLRDSGFLIVSTWHDGEEEDNANTEYGLGKIAVKDFSEVLQADVVLSLTEEPGSAWKYGSRHVEFGMGYAQGAKCVLIGKRELMFHRLPGVYQFDTIWDFLYEVNGDLDFWWKEFRVSRSIQSEVFSPIVIPEWAPLTGPITAHKQGPLTVGAMPSGPKERKDTPICTGVIDYFPLALAEVARVSKKGNDKHNPGEPLHWAREKSTDHADCLVRHQVDRGKIDPEDGQRHSAKVAWRALAQLELELEAAQSDLQTASDGK